MTVILVGRAPKGNLLVTDAIISHKEIAKSYKEYDLEEKILRLRASNFYCTVVGDAEVHDGIKYLDQWYDAKNIKIDFSKTEIMEYALIATDKIRERWIKDGCAQSSNAEANAYFVNQEQVYEYVLKIKNKKYHIENFRIFSDGEVIINYGLDIEKITGFNYPNNQLFEEAIKSIEAFHKKKKSEAKINPKTKFLHYDFVNRFCGVIFSKKKNESERQYSPFTKLSEVIAADAGYEKTTWKLIEDNKFSWSPDIDKPKTSKR